jgi:hypothetical protein
VNSFWIYFDNIPPDKIVDLSNSPVPLLDDDPDFPVREITPSVQYFGGDALLPARCRCGIN